MAWKARARPVQLYRIVTVGKVVPDWVGSRIVVPEGSVVVVLSPPNGGIVVITVDVGLFGPAVLALLVQPASITVMATVATITSLRTMRIMAPTAITGFTHDAW